MYMVVDDYMLQSRCLSDSEYFYFMSTVSLSLFDVFKGGEAMETNKTTDLVDG